jgi:hypothetical protein
VIRWLWAFVDRPLDRFGEAAQFWCAVTETTLSPRRGADREFATFLPRNADACLKLQGVQAGGGAHLDIDVDDVDAVTHAAVEEHGASVVRREGTGLSVLRTPTGMLFCITQWDGPARRPPVVAAEVLDAGANVETAAAVEMAADAAAAPALRVARLRSRVDQICFDVSPEDFARETEFWGGFTGWGAAAASGSEFARLAVPEELPVRVLLQRLDTPAAPGAHIDVACGEEVPRIRAYHERLGARWVANGEQWQVMRDPAGGLYCLTERDPDSGRLSPRG